VHTRVANYIGTVHLKYFKTTSFGVVAEELVFFNTRTGFKLKTRPLFCFL